MTKELEALKTIKIKCHPNSNPSPLVDECLEVIEQSLQRLEAIENAEPSKALETLKNMLIGNGCNDSINDYVDNLILPIKQALINKSKKELVSDIITNKLINYRKFYSDFIVSNISYDKYVEYWTNYGCEQLTEQEFNFLKEHSKNE